jgi:hypothetical protein
MLSAFRTVWSGAKSAWPRFRSSLPHTVKAGRLELVRLKQKARPLIEKLESWSRARFRNKVLRSHFKEASRDAGGFEVIKDGQRIRRERTKPWVNPKSSKQAAAKSLARKQPPTQSKTPDRSRSRGR